MLFRLDPELVQEAVDELALELHQAMVSIVDDIIDQEIG
jgi:predicted transcriptional regulator